MSRSRRGLLAALPVLAAALYDVLPLRATANRAGLVDSGTGPVRSDQRFGAPWGQRRFKVAYGNFTVKGDVNEGESNHAEDDSDESGTVSLSRIRQLS
jgi:hypothetical protein